jgi:hypothetical protein
LIRKERPFSGFLVAAVALPAATFSRHGSWTGAGRQRRGVRLDSTARSKANSGNDRNPDTCRQSLAGWDAIGSPGFGIPSLCTGLPNRFYAAVQWVLQLAQPARQSVPSGTNLGHQILFGAQRSPCDRGRALPTASSCRSNCPTDRALRDRQCSEPALAGLISGATFESHTPHALTCADSPSIVSSPTRNSERRAMRDDARTVVDVPAAEPTAW